MKKITLLIVSALMFSSCATIFTPSRQSITFTGESGIKIYDATKNMKIAEIGKEGTATVKIKKKRSDMSLIAKKEGYKPYPLLLESTFNNASLWNILFWPGFLVDLGTQNMNKWEETMFNIEMQEKE